MSIPSIPKDENCLQHNWDTKSSISSWIKYSLNFKYERKSRNDQLTGNNDMYGQINFFLRFHCPEDKFSHNIPIGSVSTCYSFKIPCISKEDYTVPNDKHNPDYFSLKQDPHFITGISLDSTQSQNTYINWIPLSLVYSTKVLILPMHCDGGLQFNENTIHTRGNLIANRNVIDNCKPYYANKLHKDKSITIHENKDLQNFLCKPEIQGHDITFLCMIDLHTERINCFSFNYQIAKKWQHTDIYDTK